MTKEKLTIRYATPEDYEKLAEFKIEQFLSSKEFTVKTPEKLGNVGGKVLMAEYMGNIISTMQYEEMSSQEFFKQYSNATFLEELDLYIYPSLYLSKAGTSIDFRKTGINSILRIIILKEALKNKTILSLTGCGYENGPRLNLLKKLGYEFSEVKLSESAYTIPNGKFFFLYLNRSKFNSALELLEQEITELKSKFEIEIILDNEF